MVTQWLAWGTKITPFLPKKKKGFISQHPLVALRLLPFCEVFCLPFPLYIFTLCSYSVCSVKMHIVNSYKCGCFGYFRGNVPAFLIKIFSIFCRGRRCFQHTGNSQDRRSSTQQLQWKVTSFFPVVLLSVWKTHKWQEDVTLQECILSWNKTQNYAKTNKAIFIAESSG